MTWFFAVLIVLAMGGVAALAAGYGRPMVDAPPDRHDVSLPAEGPITADDLRRVRFPLALRGYRMGEVDALLERLIAEREATEPIEATGPTGPTASHDGPDDEPAPDAGETTP
ncbi:hypothetical protein GCM10022215_43940 [Nocardioides fonticola]|uniref:DivIVA domain-containing protein n=1 Tax=Nocardioides fonticola TaxID=450363 RepID=A0ABP7Y439_9ACTN